MSRSRLIALAMFAALATCALRAAADGLIRDGIGPISTGRGGTNQGFADNAAIILDNPGALVNVQGTGLAELGADTIFTAVHYTDPFNDVQSKARPLPMPVLGIIQKSDDERWAWGIGAFVPAGFGASYGSLTNPLLGNNLYRSTGAMGKLLPALSYKATENLSIGISVGIAFTDVQLTGPFVFQTPPLQGLPALVNIGGFGVAPTGSVGMQYQLTDALTIGTTYTEQTNFDIHGGTNASLLLPGPTVISSHFDDKLRMHWPRSVAVGLKYCLCPHRRFGADVIWYDWAHAFNQIDLQFFNPTNPVVGGLTPLPIRDAFPLNWTNSITTRLGYEWDPNDFDTWRVGYTYHGSPVPDATLNPFLDGVLEHGFSVGFSRKMQRATLNVAYQYNFGKPRAVGTSAIVGGLFDNTTLNAQAQFLMLSLLFPF